MDGDGSGAFVKDEWTIHLSTLQREKSVEAYAQREKSVEAHAHAKTSPATAFGAISRSGLSARSVVAHHVL